MLLVNFEAREVTQEVYKPPFKQALSHSAHSVYFNLNIDLLCITEEKVFYDLIMDRTMNWEYNQEEELCNIIVCRSFLGQAITSLSDMPSLSTLVVGGRGIDTYGERQYWDRLQRQNHTLPKRYFMAKERIENMVTVSNL
jgi:hypothetical protein